MRGIVFFVYLCVMKHFLLTIFLAVAAATQAQVTAEKAFTVAPDEVMMLLGPSVRLDMLDYFHAGSTKQSANATGGRCRIVDEKPYSLTVQASDSTVYQIFVLNPMEERPVLGVIETVATPVRDSVMRLYNYRWEPLSKSPFTPPSLRTWLIDDSKDATAAAEEQIPFMLAEYAYNPDSAILTITPTVGQYFSPGDRPDALANIRKQLNYYWNGKNFKLLDR